jgi:diaminohydroxyphosphoribosylaminopyrimidine deaminase / 5-amino-6-(5-phosphoribosylamino)uracil reductase
MAVGRETRRSLPRPGARRGVSEQTGDDAAGMRAAIRAAQRGSGMASPNPLVGAALRMPGRGLVTAAHLRFGGPHAEARLLDRVAPDGALPDGATLFVTLEPCSHHGKTPPCADRLIRARPSRVVVACLDPDPRVAGRGIARLRAAGIPVAVGPGEDDALGGNLPFHVRHRLGRSLVRLKLASSLDARLGLPPGRERRITGDPAMVAVHRERSGADAVLVGSGTMVADDPLLTVRAVRGPDPSRIVLDSGLRTDPKCRAWRVWKESAVSLVGAEEGEEATGNYRLVSGRFGLRWVRRARLILATRLGHPQQRLEAYRGLGWEVWELPAGRSVAAGTGRVSLRALAVRAGREGYLRILVEAGPGLAGALLGSGLVDELSLYLAPIVLGGSLAWPADWQGRSIRRAPRFEPIADALLGDDRHLLLRRAGLLDAVRWKGHGGRRAARVSTGGG